MDYNTADQRDSKMFFQDSSMDQIVPIRVVHLVSALHAGGIERLLLAMAPYWDRTRFSIEVWCLNVGSTQAYLDALQERGVQVQILGRLERERIEPRVLWRLIKALVRHQISIIHSHTPYPLAVAMLARLFLGSRVLHIHHQHLPPVRYQILPMRMLGRIKPPDHMIAVSTATATSTRTLLGNLPFPLSVIHNGVEIPNLEYDMSDTPAHYVFTAARLTAQKNIDLLLIAMQKIQQICPMVTLTILGEGELRPALQEKAKLLGIEKQIHFLGYTYQPEQYYSSLGLFVLPSLYEGMPLALLEAMAWGKPCIATKVDGVSEVLRNEENGLLVPSNDSEAMANAILKIIKDPVLARRLGCEARKAAQEFSIQKTVDQIQALYMEHIQLATKTSLNTLPA